MQIPKGLHSCARKYSLPCEALQCPLTILRPSSAPEFETPCVKHHRLMFDPCVSAAEEDEGSALWGPDGGHQSRGTRGPHHHLALQLQRIDGKGYKVFALLTPALVFIWNVMAQNAIRTWNLLLSCCTAQPSWTQLFPGSLTAIYLASMPGQSRQVGSWLIT